MTEKVSGFVPLPCGLDATHARNRYTFDLLGKPRHFTTLGAPAISAASQLFGDVKYDVSLTLLQLGKYTLAAASTLALVTAMAVRNADDGARLATIASGCCCAIGSIFYSRLIKLRRLSLTLAYCEESDLIADGMRAVSWAISISLLSWSALLLRGPFASPEFVVGLWAWEWDYAHWLKFGPGIIGLCHFVALTGYRAAAFVAPGSKPCTNNILWFVSSGLILLTTTLISWNAQIAIATPSRRCNPCERTDGQFEFGVFMSTVWWAYVMYNVGGLAIVNLARLCQTNTRIDTSDSNEDGSQSRGCWQMASTFCRYALLTCLLAPIHEDTDLTRVIYRSIDSNSSEELISLVRRSPPRQSSSPPNGVLLMLTQILEASLALLDIFVQAVSAVGCAALLVPSVTDGLNPTPSDCCS
jgi:hypothetical protein